MKYTYARERALAMASVIVLSIGTSAWAYADSTTDSNPRELRKIMRELGRNMQTITDGISREDWALVAKVAPLIANHPQPPLGERMRVLALVGSDISTFRDLDERTHQAAKMLEHDAMRDDGNRVITDFGRLQSSCFACHQSFRKSFTDHF